VYENRFRKVSTNIFYDNVTRSPSESIFLYQTYYRVGQYRRKFLQKKMGDIGKFGNIGTFGGMRQK
jgi:hypothetical protein